MSQRSLLFSSDPETSRRLAHALRELEFSVDHCPEIFAAVERITTHTFELIITDWDDGVEAMFLIKTARELNCNHDAFRIVIARPEAEVAARQAGAQMVISKPILPGHTKYALLTSDDFVRRMKNWHPAMSPQNLPAPPKPAQPQPAPVQPAAKTSWMHQPAVSDEEVGMSLTFGALENDSFFRRLGIQFDAIPHPVKPRFHFFLWATVAVAALSTGYIFSGVMKARAPSASLPSVLRSSQSAGVSAPAPPLRTAESKLTIRVTPAHAEASPIREMAALETAAPPPPADDQPADTATISPESRPSIPASLTVPLQPEIGARATNPKPADSLMSSVEPVSVAEDLAEKLVLQRVLPDYPAQAVQSRLQGAVLLQAWIRKDGTVRDLKVINGPLVLCQAAFNAVKQWRYKPIQQNGQSVEAQTYVTVNFRLP